MVLHDNHVHSFFSEDSVEDYAAYVKKAYELGCKYFITTEHLDFDLARSGKDWLVDYEKMKKLQEQLKEKYNLTFLLGIELGFRKDKLDLIKKWYDSQDFDLVNLSIHDSGEFEYYYIESFKNQGFKETLDYYYKQMSEAIDLAPDFDVLSHIDYAYKTVYNASLYNKEIVLFDFFEHLPIIKEILEKLIKKGKALEINTKVQSAFPDTHLISLLSLYKSLGGYKLTLSSDAHSLDRYLADFDHYKEIIKKQGFTYLCYYIKRKEYHFDI